MSTEDHARIRWVKLPNNLDFGGKLWWPALVYNDFDEALRLSTSDTGILSQLFSKYWSTFSSGQSVAVAFLLGDIENKSDKYMLIEDPNDDNYVRSFYEYFGHFHDESSALKSAISEAAARMESRSNLTQDDYDSRQKYHAEISRNDVTTSCRRQENATDAKVVKSNDPQTKRPRGRPKRIENYTPVKESNSKIYTTPLVNLSSRGQENATLMNDLQTKRPRGRPKRTEDRTHIKKHASEMYAKPVVTPPQKKPRGRPGRLKKEDDGGSNNSVDSQVTPILISSPQNKVPQKSTVRQDISTSSVATPTSARGKQILPSLPGNFTLTTDKEKDILWSKLQIIGWRHLPDQNWYVTPGTVVRDGKEGVDYFKSWNRALAYVREELGLSDACGSTRKNRKTKKTIANAKSPAKLAKKSNTIKHSIKNKKVKEEKSINNQGKKKRFEKANIQSLLEDETILKPEHPFHRNFNVMLDSLNDMLSHSSQNPKLIHVLGGPGKTVATTMACKHFSKTHPDSKLMTLYYSAERTSNKDLISQIGFMLGLSLLAKPAVIENVLKTSRNVLCILDKADKLLLDEGSNWNHLFKWAYSSEFNFSMILISNSSLDEKIESLSGLDLCSMPKLVFPDQ